MKDYMNRNFLPRSAYGLTFMTAERSYIVANRYTFWWTVLCLQGTLQWAVIPLFASTRTLPIEISYPVNELVCASGDLYLCFNWKKEGINRFIAGNSILSNHLFSA